MEKDSLNLLILTSSHRKNGNTASTVSLLKEDLRRLSQSQGENTSHTPQVHSEIVFLAHENIRTCRGCRICFDKGEEHCPLRDELLPLKKKIDAADLLILASPVYVEDINGVMKNWIDRMSFICHRPEYSGKGAYVLSTSAIGSTSHTLRTMSTALRAWGFTVFGSATFVTGALMKKEEITQYHGNRISRIAEQILRDYNRKKHKKPSFFSFLIFKVQQLYYKKHEEEGSLDHSYWKNHGWTEKGVTYYTAHRANPLKVAAARLVGSFVSRFVLK